MRIIGGISKGRVVHPPKGLPVRPTTDFAKEALFNILNNQVDLEGSVVLDLFAGTGNMAFEFASRGAQAVTAVDMHTKCVGWIHEGSKQLNLNIQVIKSDVFHFLNGRPYTNDIIFADPPYDLSDLLKIPTLVFDKGWLKDEGILILEHGKQTVTSHLPYFIQERKYGNVHFSFFKKSP